MYIYTLGCPLGNVNLLLWYTYTTCIKTLTSSAIDWIEGKNRICYVSMCCLLFFFSFLFFVACFLYICLGGLVASRYAVVHTAGLVGSVFCCKFTTLWPSDRLLPSEKWSGRVILYDLVWAFGLIFCRQVAVCHIQFLGLDECDYFEWKRMGLGMVFVWYNKDINLNIVDPQFII